MTELNRTDLRRFQDQLPFYQNGTLDAAERLWMQEQAQRYPEYALLISKEEQFAAVLFESIQSVRPETSDRIGLDRARRRWRAELERQNERAKGWWRRVIKVPIIAVAGVAAAAAAQIGYIAMIFAPMALAPSRGLQSECRLEPRIQLTFRSNVSWEDAVVLVRAYGLIFRDGPNEDGQVLMAVPAGKTAEAIQLTLKSEKALELVEVIEPKKSPECKP